MKRIIACIVAVAMVACLAPDASAWTPAQRRAARQNFRQHQRQAIRAQQFHHGQQIILAPSVYQVPGTQTIILR